MGFPVNIVMNKIHHHKNTSHSFSMIMTVKQFKKNTKQIKLYSRNSALSDSLMLDKRNSVPRCMDLKIWKCINGEKRFFFFVLVL